MKAALSGGAGTDAAKARAELGWYPSLAEARLWS